MNSMLNVRKKLRNAHFHGSMENCPIDVYDETLMVSRFRKKCECFKLMNKCVATWFFRPLLIMLRQFFSQVYM